MGIFGKNTTKKPDVRKVMMLANVAMNAVADGVVLISAEGKILYMNPAGLTMTGYASLSEVVNLSYASALRFEDNLGDMM